MQQFLDNNLTDIQYEGFEPDGDSETYVRDAVSKMLDSCPYDSRARVRVFDLSEEYRVEIAVNHVAGKFQAVGEEVTLREALNAAINKIDHQLEDWRLTRFKDGPEHGFDVLLVDDDPLSIKLLETCFHQNGCRTVAVENGERALEKMEKKKFDLIVMDWNMPRLDGGKTLSALDRKMSIKAARSGAEFGKLPVLTYSIYEKNKIQFPDTKNFFRMGHLSKMASYQALQSVTSEFLRKLKGSAGLTMAIQ
jgi:CheY-like chemotaxis protein